MGKDDGLGDIDDSTTGWKFTETINKDDGYFLDVIEHDGIPFINQMLVERVLVSRHPKKGRKNVVAFRLADDGVSSPVKITRTAGPKLTRPGKSEKGPLGYYNPRLVISLSWEVTGLFDEPKQKLTIDQQFLFTPYAKDPSHEPSGAVSAARIYPLITFRVDSSEIADATNTICAVQVIYSIGLGIGEAFSSNQAGIFHDLDRAGGVVWGAATYLFSGLANTVFDRAEKPVLYEVVGTGIDRTQGGPWDNVHAWARVGPKTFPPTPGLPYGLHTHWRWGETAYDGSWILDGGPQFGGFAGAGTPIVDPDLPDQSLEFAITLSDANPFVQIKIDKDPDATFKDFAWPFQQHRSDPKDLQALFDTGVAGYDLLLWKALTAYSKNYDASTPDRSHAFKGRLFVHGLFCAHESSDVLGTLPLNAYDAQFEPMPKNMKKHLKYMSTHWRRPSGGEP